MARRDSDLNLLFGILALQMDFIARDALIASMGVWALEKHRTIGEILVERGDLDPTDRALLGVIVDRHLARHNGDPVASLVAVSSIDSTAEALRQSVADPDVLASIAHFSTESQHDPHATRPPDSTDYVPAAIRYRKVRDHAKGGLGIVFVAHDEELRREVALKEIKPEFADNLASQSRFLREAEITGGLEHPGIVPVYGLGAYEDGRPFYAMRFIKGDSLKDAITAFHADETLKRDPGARTLALQKLLRRFLDVCNAIAYAHSRGVLHRDLKPDNVMVGRYGETLVVDWGLAKAVGRSSDDGYGQLPESTFVTTSSSNSAETLPGSVIGTPAYMSPEQAAGRPDLLGPASDVYSLGATLYTLLTGRVPIADKDISEILRKVERGELPRPREASPWLDPALEAITLKAMATRPDDRYASPRTLADDLERWLADEPVTAHRDPWTRRARRWAKRNRTAVTAAVASLLVGLVGLGAVAAVQTKARNDLTAKNSALDEQRKRAEDREAQAIAAVKRFGEVISNEPELKSNPAFNDLRQRLMKEPLSFFGALRDRLQADRDTRPESLARLAQASFDLAKLTNEIGDKQDALIAYRESLLIRQKLADDQPTDTRFRCDLAKSHINLGLLLRETGQEDQALKAYQSALPILQKLANDHPTVTEFQSSLALCHNCIGVLVSDESDQALKALRSGLLIRQKLADDHPTVTQFQNDLAASHLSLGGQLHYNDKLDQALKEYRSALLIGQKLADGHLTDTEIQSSLAKSHLYVGVVLWDIGQTDQALKEYQSALLIRQKLAKDHPTVTQFQSDLAMSHNVIGALLSETGQPDKTLESYQSALLIRQKLTEDHPTVTQFRTDLANSHFNIGAVLWTTGQPGQALKPFQSGLLIQKKLADDHPTVTEFQSSLAWGLNHIGALLLATGQPDQAFKEYQSALLIRQKLADDHPTVAQFQCDLAASRGNMGALLGVTGQPSQAREALQSALLIVRKLAREHPESLDYPSHLGAFLDTLALLDVNAKRFEEARVQLREAIESQRKALAANPRNSSYRQFMARHLIILIKAARGLGDTEGVAEAERELAKLRDSDPANVALDDRLSAIIKGNQKPKDNRERIQLARRANEKAFHAVAAKLRADALDADPKLAEDRGAWHRLTAACSAALAGCGQGKDDPAPDDKAKAKLREQARGWLQAELAACTKLVESGTPRFRAFIVLNLQNWQKDTDLAGIRDEAELAKLPEVEREALRSLWADVEALRVKAGGGK
jgi:eukaryotic-like serine/threonine-protein kinase